MVLFAFNLGKQFGATFVSFDELLHQSDYVFVSCPLNNETRNMFDKVAFGKMKNTSIFINVSRGGMLKANIQENINTNWPIFIHNRCSRSR